MINLSAAAILEKNKLESDKPWFVLLEVQFHDPSSTNIKVVRNTENVTWNGDTWIAFPFTVDRIGEVKKAETPQFIVSISNVTGSLQKPLEDSLIEIRAVVTLRVINELSPSNIPEIELTYFVRSAQSNSKNITFTLGSRNIFDIKYPNSNVLKNNCRFEFKSAECKYAGPESKCNKTLKRCTELNNSIEFGGFPGVGREGFTF